MEIELTLYYSGQMGFQLPLDVKLIEVKSRQP